MKDKGIIFSAAMVKALLAGTKTQTRRLCDNPHHLNSIQPLLDAPGWFGDDEGEVCFSAGYKPGQRLYVRESIRCFADVSDDVEITYFADDRAWQTGPCTGDIPDSGLVSYFKLRDRAKEAGKAVAAPSIHMPRWASRLWLAVTDVRVERLQSISEADAIAEGIFEVRSPDTDGMRHFGTSPDDSVWPTAGRAYRNLWDSLHTEPGQRWEDNPFVVAVSFTVHRGNIDREAA